MSEKRVPYSRAQVNAVYFSYLNREGPTNLGTIEWPKPKPGCLSGMKFLTTGVLDTITREDAIDLLTKCGGHVMSGMSKNLTYLIVGREAGKYNNINLDSCHVSLQQGPVKLEKAADWGLNQLSEEEFFKFITDKIDNYDPSQGNGVEEKKKKPVVKKSAVKKAEVKEEAVAGTSEPKVEAKTKKSEKKNATVVKKADMKPAKVDKKPKASRVRVPIEIDMAEEGDSAKVTKKRVKEEPERNGKPSKKPKESKVKDEPDSESEGVPVVTEPKPSKKKEKAIKKEAAIEEKEAINPRRGRSKK